MTSKRNLIVIPTHAYEKGIKTFTEGKYYDENCVADPLRPNCDPGTA
jgi:hypothetical protein